MGLSEVLKACSLKPSTATLIAFLVITSSIYAYQLARKTIRERNVKNKLACKPARKLQQKKAVLGFDAAWTSIKAAKGHRLLETSRARFREMGTKTFSMNVLGRQLIYTIEPENLKAIMATSFNDWSLPSQRKTAFGPAIGEGVFTLDGEGWKHSREMLKPNFAKSQAGNLDMLAGHVDQLIRACKDEMASSGVAELGHLFFRLTTDSATELLFGDGTHFLENPKERFAEAFDGALEHVGLVSRIGSVGHLLKPKKVKGYEQYLHDFVDYYVDQAVARRQTPGGKVEKGGEDERYTFVNELARQTGDRRRIRSELLNILLAGRDTTASLLTNLWWVLARRPDVYERLQAEVGTISSEDITLDSLKSMKYLRAVINECLRLYPVVPLNSREAVNTTTLPRGGGQDEQSPVLIPAGSTVVWSLYAMHRNPEFFGDDAETFSPDRWLDNSETGEKGLRPGWEYLPFNGGPRICLGQNFAINESSYTTVRLCQEFASVEARDNLPWTEMLTVTCINKHGAKVSLTSK